MFPSVIFLLPFFYGPRPSPPFLPLFFRCFISLTISFSLTFSLYFLFDLRPFQLCSFLTNSFPMCKNICARLSVLVERHNNIYVLQLVILFLCFSLHNFPQE